MNYTLHVSQGNRKLGIIPSISLPSGATCSSIACKTCYTDCYYRRHVELLYKKARENSRENYEYAKNEPIKFEKELNWYFDNPNAPRKFRIHVGGDFFSTRYYETWLRVMRAHPDTKFLALSKQFDIIAPYVDDLPGNFTLILSAWPGVPLPERLSRKLPVAWMQDGSETRIPIKAVECSGRCDHCARCWKIQGDVVFKKH